MDTTFTNGVTLTDADWFNDVNRLHYTIFGDPTDKPAAAGALVSGLTEDTSPDKIADFVPAYDASAATGKKLRLITAMAKSMPFGQGLLINGKISTSVGSNALTIAVKGDDGNDPSSTNPVYVLFRKATLTDSGFDVVAITSALSVVVSSGSTLGHASAIAQHIFVYLINNSGTAELAVSNLPPDYPGTFGKARLVSTTAEGGAGAADSATGVYSTTARSNVPWICVAKMLSTQTTAGTWAAAITQIDQAPFVIPSCAFFAYCNGGNTGAATPTKVQNGTEHFDFDSVYDSVTNYRYQPNVAGVYYCSANVGIGTDSAGQLIGYIYKNGGIYTQSYNANSTAAATGAHTTVAVVMNGTSDYLEGYVYNSPNSIAVGGNSYLTGHRISQGGV